MSDREDRSATAGSPNPDASAQERKFVASNTTDSEPLLASTIAALHRLLENQFSRESRSQSFYQSQQKETASGIKLRPPPLFTCTTKFDAWEAQFNAYIEAHRVPYFQQTAVLLSLLAPECQEYFLNNNLTDQTCEEALKSMRARYTDSNVREKSYMELVAAHQNSTESIAEFYDRLASYARLADLSSTEAEPLLRARLCHGIRDKVLAEKLLLWSSDAGVSDESSGAKAKTVPSAELVKKAKEIVGIQQLLQPAPNSSANIRVLETEKASLEARVEELERLLRLQNQAGVSKPVAVNQPQPSNKSIQNSNQHKPHNKHKNKQPPNHGATQQFGTAVSRSRKCYRCGGEDHFIADCPITPAPPIAHQTAAKSHPPNNQAQHMSEVGSIVSWKGNFGFIQSEQLPDQLFFHRGELSESLNRSADQHQLVGTRVQFHRKIDSGKKRDQACGVRPIPSINQTHLGQTSSDEPAVDSSFFVQLRIGDNQVMACLDSGANASVMGKQAMERLVEADPINNIFSPAHKDAKATAFNGSTTQILGSLRCEVELGKIKKHHVFLVTEESTAESLLGIDFLRGFQVLLDFTCGQVLVAGGAVPVIEGDKGVFRIRRVLAACTSELPPHSETLVPSRVIDTVPNLSGTVSSELFNTDSEFFVARSVDRVSPTNHVLVRLLNSSDQPARIERDQEIASFQELGHGEVVVPTALSEKDFSIDNCNLLNSKLSRLPPPEKGTAEWLVKQFRLDQSSLTPNQLALTLRMLNYFLSQISQDDSDLGRTKLHEMSIDLIEKDSRPVLLASRRTTPAQKEFLDQHISQLLKQDVIEECDSDWVSPIVLVKKKDGSQRLCIDYRAVNKLIRPCSFPLPLIEESFDSLAGSSVFSSLDLTSAYWQVGIKEEDRDFTAFSCPQGTFRWKVIPFGIKTAPANFAKLMHKVFQPLLMKVSLIYLDDIIIKAQNNDQMIAHLALVLWQLRKANLKIKPAKCELFKDRVKFLGFIVSSNGIEADPAKTRAVQEWCRPKDKKQLMAFLGFANYYRKFVQRFSVIATPLYALAKGSEKFVWLERHERAFQELKRCLCNPPVLAYPDLSTNSRGFVLDCDSSLEGVGGVLSQIGPDGSEQVVAYASKKFSQSQSNYCATMRELLGLVLMLEHFRTYLLDRPFTVRVDAAALQWLHSKKHATGMLAQWLATIDLYEFKIKQSALERVGEYDFEVQYRPGKDHVAADMLSRNPRFRADHFDCPSCSMVPEFQEKFKSEKAKKSASVNIKRQQVDAAVQCSVADVCCQTDSPVTSCHNIETVVASACQTETFTSNTSTQCTFFTTVPVTEAAVEATMPIETSRLAVRVAEVEQSASSESSVESVDPELEWARESQETCVDIAQLIDCVQGRTEKPPKASLQSCSREVRILWSLFDELKVENGLLYHLKPKKNKKSVNKLLVIPETADVVELVSKYHRQLNHCGITKTLTAIRSRFAIADLETYVKGIIAECDVCARTKKSKLKHKAPLQPELSGYPNQVVHVDHAGPFPEQAGYRYLLVMVDRFSGFVEVIPVADVSAETTAVNILTEWIARYGCMEQIVSDNGTAFVNSTVSELTRLLEVDMARVTARRPQANGKVERMIQTVKGQIRAICLDRQFDWPLAARLAALSIRATVAESTGFSPAKIFFGHELNLVHNPPVQDRYRPELYAHYLHQTLVEVSAAARHARGKAQERQKRYYDRSALNSNFEIGDLVWVLNADHRGLDSAVWFDHTRWCKRFRRGITDSFQNSLE
ncbi:hypothetical protein BOX15_Mlig011200g1 [Macrostomum lignano]|uniref:Reverse transcriptase n=1 Tax=Macrostomum lignano TaxID=282301 RepID=A0A267FGL7_9PLAT|nr:hypothetical protein BOX15_Mlig011200g1 [Macrostomum lignano]